MLGGGGELCTCIIYRYLWQEVSSWGWSVSGGTASTGSTAGPPWSCCPTPSPPCLATTQTWRPVDGRKNTWMWRLVYCKNKFTWRTFDYKNKLTWKPADRKKKRKLPWRIVYRLRKQLDVKDCYRQNKLTRRSVDDQTKKKFIWTHLLWGRPITSKTSQHKG